MLDKQKVMHELIKSMPTVFKETNQERALAHEIFSRLQQDPDAQERVQRSESSITIPSWEGPLDEARAVTQHEHPYQVVAVDGSQIYPDRHQGMACYLLNSGVAHFAYGDTSTVRLFSTPIVFNQQQSVDMSEEMVNCRRTELEFEVGLTESVKARSLYPELPSLFLCDGSLIFWHLESKHPRIKEHFLKRYIEQLGAFYEERIPIAGFISLPKSKELVSILRKACDLNLVKATVPCSFDTVVDTDVVHFYLKRDECTKIFIHNSTLANAYPPHLRPCFFYMLCVDEIARIEIPSWVAQDEKLLNRVVSIVLDQSYKGNGYPIALSEAHEQAVVNSAERQFFLEMLYKMAVDQNYTLYSSQKSLKKKFVSI